MDPVVAMCRLVSRFIKLLHQYSIDLACKGQRRDCSCPWQDYVA